MKMKRIFQITLLNLIVILLSSCSSNEVKPEIKPKELLVNGSVEIGSLAPNSWWNSNGNGKYDLSWSEEESFTPKKSLKISSKIEVTTSFAFWAQTISTNLPTGKSVTLKVKAKGNLTGQGISFAIRGDDATSVNGYAKQFATTQGTSPISGTFNWTEYSVKLNNVDASLESITIYVIFLNNTFGDVYFDDISLTY